MVKKTSRRPKPEGYKALPRDAAAALSSRSRFWDNVAGITFHGRRNLFEALGYDRIITNQMYRSRYKRNAVAARIVEAMPKATWRGGAEVIENEDPTQTDFEKGFEAMERKLNLWSMFHRADILTGLGRYCILLLGTPGELHEPLTRLDPSQLIYITPFSEEDAPIDKFDNKIDSPRYGLPEYYSVRRIAPNALRYNTPESKGRRVHYTRVIHIADTLLDDHVYGVPRLERVWNLLDDLEKVTGGGAEAFWKRADQGMVLDLDPMINLVRDTTTGKFPELESLKEQVNEYEHALKRVLTTRGVKVQMLGSDVSDISSTVSSLMSQISAGSEIPQRILMGSEAAKLASSQDADTWDERVMDRRTEYAAPQIVRPFVQRMIELQALPKPVGDFDVRWPEVKNMNEAQRAAVAVQWAGMNKAAGMTIVTGDEIRDRILGLGKLPQNVTRTVSFELPVVKTAPPAALPAPRSASSWVTAKGKERSGWAHIPATADRFLGSLKRVMTAAFTAARQSVDDARLRQALTLKNYRSVEELLSGPMQAMERSMASAVPQVLAKVRDTAGQLSTQALHARLKANALRAAKEPIDIRTGGFDATNPEAVKWVQDHTGELISGVLDTTRENIRALVEQAFQGDFDVDELASRIDAEIGDDDRAETIARTETMTASNEGQQEAWSQAADDGLLTGDETQVWIITDDDRLCDECNDLDGATAGLDESFQSQSGDEYDGPPAHPRCRCTVGLQLPGEES